MGNLEKKHNLDEYMESNWKECMTTISELAANNNYNDIDSSKGVYDFDKITEIIHGNNNRFHSVDGIYIDNNELVFLEFKTGFKDKVSLNEPCKCAPCKHRNERCDDLDKATEEKWELFKKFRNLTKENMKRGIVLKAIDSYITCYTEVYSKCNIDGIKTKLLIVVDVNSEEAMEEMLQSSSKNKKEKIKTNIKSIKDALSVRNSYKSNGLGFHYDNIQVMPIAEYKKYIEQWN